MSISNFKLFVKNITTNISISLERKIICQNQRLILKFTIFFLFFISLFLFLPSNTYAVESILNFDSSYIIKPSSNVLVKETIEYDFGSDLRHGIFRDIPYIYTNDFGDRYVITINVKGVSDLNGTPYKYSISKQGDNVQLKIGDPNKKITGKNVYVIEYEVEGGISYYSDHDEFSWNVNGFGWNVPIQIVRSAVLLDSPNGGFDNAVCFTGFEGSKESNCRVVYKNNFADFSGNGSLAPGQNMTIAVSFPKGLVDEVAPVLYKGSSGSSGGDSFFENAFFTFLILFNVLFPFVLLVIWLFLGRDPKINRTILREYDPPKTPDGKRDLTPMEVGAIVDEVINPRDISAEIVNLAILKYVKIVERKEKSFLFNNKKIYFARGEAYNSDSELKNLTSHQKRIIQGLDIDSNEESSLDDIKLSFSTKVKNINDDLYESLTGEEYFRSNPEKLRKLLYGLAIGLIFFFQIIPAISLIIFSKYLPRKTVKGALAKNHALGLKKFLVSQERQFEFQEKNLYLFEKLLPYAISFGVAKTWAEKFKDISNYQTDWYQSSDPNVFTTMVLINSLQKDLSVIQTAYAATSTSSSGGFSSSFGGGGFSGGGFGGGGGGSW